MWNQTVELNLNKSPPKPGQDDSSDEHTEIKNASCRVYVNRMGFPFKKNDSTIQFIKEGQGGDRLIK